MKLALEDLTPAEAQLLVEPNKTPAKNVLRTSLLHLAASGHLRSEVQRKRSWLDAGGARVARGPAATPPPEPLRVVLEAVFPPWKTDAPLTPNEMLHRLQQVFGHDYSRYVTEHLRPLLERRGLVEVEEYTWLRVFRRKRYRHTAAGARLRADIEARLGTAKELAAAVYLDPSRAVALAEGMGGLVLIAEGLRPHLKALGRAASAHPDGATGLLVSHYAEDDEERRTGWLHAAEMMAELDWGIILDAIDSMGDAFDGGADGGGGDGGGDGGGGE